MTSPKRPHIDRDDFTRVDAVLLAVSGLIAVALLFLAALGIYPFAGAVAAYVVVFALAAAAHALAASLLVTVYVEARHDDWTFFGDVGHVVLGLAAVALAAGLFLVDRWVVNVGPTSRARAVYVVLLGIAALVSLAFTANVLATEHGSRGATENVFLHVLAGMAGVVAGAALIAGLIGALAWYRQANLPMASIRIPPLQGISGTYVALGDSYSSGEGLPPFVTGTESVTQGGNECHRSQAQAYPRVLSFEPTQPAVQFSACSGAITQDVYASFEKAARGRPAVTVGPQVDQAVHPEVGLVTLTIGGDDVLFTDVVTACFEFSNCLRHQFTPKKAPPDHPNLTWPPPQRLETWGPAMVDVVSQRAAALYTHLRRTYPNARIVAIGYPYLFPAGRAGFQPNDCASILRRFSLVERTGIRKLEDRFNSALYQQAVAAGIEFVSPVAVWDGHEPCGTKGQYLNSLKPILSFPNPIDNGSFHPTADGQRQLAALVACYLATYPQTPTVPRPPDPPGSKEVPLGCDL